MLSRRDGSTSPGWLGTIPIHSGSVRAPAGRKNVERFFRPQSAGGYFSCRITLCTICWIVSAGMPKG
ncbi:hypothetical protein K227x_10940 [Rubripirellula lacrimiformis]|uniref:Uncharacterized protein n=1 Tax=Rubripirellula lacrimiformis TaxID=1930273 RepID=A0A517N6E8_9BACT|nr:hypothetical protein K227x_10940 [Rubripirellula lacrimiformis]